MTITTEPVEIIWSDEHSCEEGILYTREETVRKIAWWSWQRFPITVGILYVVGSVIVIKLLISLFDYLVAL